MPVKWSPNGFLDVATDPQDLPEQGDGKGAVSGAMTRCTNMHLDRMGIATTRRGSAKVSSTDIGTTIHRIIEQDGVRYEFVDGSIYRDETLIESGLTKAMWSAILYNAYNVETQNVFALNGTNRKRIVGSDVFEWGIDPPALAPVCEKGVSYLYTHDWEEDETTVAATTSRKWTTTQGDYECVFEWEVDHIDGDEVFEDTYSQNAQYSFELYDPDQKWLVKYTYCRKAGDVLECESNPSPEAEMHIESGAVVTWVASPDSQVTHVRIYRTLGDQGVFYYDSEYDVADLTAVLSKRDEALGTEVSTDHDRPPLGTMVWGVVSSVS